MTLGFGPIQLKGIGDVHGDGEDTGGRQKARLVLVSLEFE